MGTPANRTEHLVARAPPSAVIHEAVDQTQSGRLLTTGSSKCTFRRNPNYEEERKRMQEMERLES